MYTNDSSNNISGFSRKLDTAITYLQLSFANNNNIT